MSACLPLSKSCVDAEEGLYLHPTFRDNAAEFIEHIRENFQSMVFAGIVFASVMAAAKYPTPVAVNNNTITASKPGAAMTSLRLK